MKKILLIGIASLSCLAAFAEPLVSNADGQSNDARQSVEIINGYDDAQTRQSQTGQTDPGVGANASHQAELLSRMGELQETIQKMQGDLELQAHRIETLEQQQKAFYQDIDQRINMMNQQPNRLSSVNHAPAAAQYAKPTKLSLSEKQAYDAAFAYVNKKQYKKAINAMQRFLTDYPNGPYSANAHYWLGELSLLTGDRKQAQLEFNTVLVTNPNHPKAADAALKLGMMYYGEQQWSLARQTFNKLKHQFPGSTAARLASLKLTKMTHEGH